MVKLMKRQIFEYDSLQEDLSRSLRFILHQLNISLEDTFSNHLQCMKTTLSTLRTNRNKKKFEKLCKI